MLLHWTAVIGKSVFFIYLEHYGTTQPIRPIASIALFSKSFKNYYCITLTCSIRCVTFLVLSKWFGQWSKPGVLPLDLGFSMLFCVFLLKIWVF